MTDPLPLFPLRSVLFPGALLHLKIFEARYLDLVSRCLRDAQPFGVVCLAKGGEVGRQGVELEEVGVLARIDDVDAEQSGILQIRCTGTQRFRRTAEATQQPDGLWVCNADAVAEDPAHAPGPAMQPTVAALHDAIGQLRDHGPLPFAEPFRLDDAGWVANRWCELLPLALSAKQKLMALEDPVIRLSLVDGFLRDKKVVIG